MPHASLHTAIVLVPVVASLLAVLLVSSPWVSAQVDPAAVYRQYTEAINRGDVEAAAVLFTDDAVQESLRCTPCVGKGAMRADLAGRVGNHVQYTVVSTEVSGATVIAHSEVRSDTVRSRGFERIVNIDTMEIREGKIAAWRVRNDTSDPQTAAFVAAQQAQPAAALSRAGGVTLPLQGMLLAGATLLLLGALLRRRLA